MDYRLGLDVGATSIGWCILSLENNEPKEVIDMGVRIFSDGRDEKSKPLAVARREARGQRRRRDRFKSRQQELMDFFIANDLMPRSREERKALEAKDPYEIRAKALDQKVSLHEFGRALFHINQRRGFNSNRKDKKQDEKESGKIKSGIKKLQEKLQEENCRTLGEYLYKRKKNKEATRVKANLDAKDNMYDFYPERSMLEQEVNLLWEKQRLFHPELNDKLLRGTDGDKKQPENRGILDIIFYQRPLKSQEQNVGLCELEENQKRARLAYPITQQFRIYQEVNNLNVLDLNNEGIFLTTEHRNSIALLLLKQKTAGFDKIRKKIKLDKQKFNLEDGRRKELKGDETSYLLSKPEYFGDLWRSLPFVEQNAIIDKIFTEDDVAKFNAFLCDKNYNLTEKQIENIANAESGLKTGYGNLSVKAMEKILPHLQTGLIYSEACEQAGYNHSETYTGERFKQLPYYGEILPKSVIGGKGGANKPSSASKKNYIAEAEKYYGKINNPTVHTGLNQLRKLINTLIKTYSHPPQEIVIELARELKTSAEDINKEQKRNKKENDRINAELKKLNVTENGKNRMQYKLWEDLSRDPIVKHCPFTGKQISANDIFSGEFEIEHLLPFSRTFDDSRANKVLCSKRANRDKGERTPFEAFGHSPEGYNWQEILRRANNLPENKRRRFAPDAMKRFDEDNGPIARQLKDTQYFAKITQQYLVAICPKNKVWNITGQLTALLRNNWQLNKLLHTDKEENIKNRADHRHHAIDALVVACTSISALQKLIKASENSYLRDRLIENLEPPFIGFDRQKLEQIVNKIVISHKSDHGGARQAVKQGKTIAKLHKETAYGYIGNCDKKRTLKLAERCSITSFENIKNINKIADPIIREKLLGAVGGLTENSQEWKTALIEFSKQQNVKKVRSYFDGGEDSHVGIFRAEDKGQEGTKPYKYIETGGNYCADIYCPIVGKNAKKWQIEIITNFAAHRKNFEPKWRKTDPTAKLIMRLQIDDMVAYEDNGVTKICRVKKIDMRSKRVYLREHFISQEEGDKLSWAASANLLQKKEARKIYVDVLGKVKDIQKKS